MSQNEVRYLQEKSACQGQEICHLKEKSKNHSKILTKKDALQKWFSEVQRWIEEAETKQKRSNDEQLRIIECQFKKLEKSELAITTFRVNNHRLNDIIKCQETQLMKQQQIEQRLIADIEKLEISKKNLENQLCNVKDQLQEKCNMVEILKKQLKCKQEELQCERMKLEKFQAMVEQLEEKCKDLETDVVTTKAKIEEFQVVHSRLQEQCRDLEAYLKCTLAKLEDAKSHAIATEAQLKTKVNGLAKVLEFRARKLRETETECDEWKRQKTEQQCRVNKLDALAVELRAMSERERGKTEAREQRLKRDVCERTVEVRRRDEKLTATQHENEDAASAAAVLKTRVRATESSLEDAKRSAEEQDQAQNAACERTEHEKAALSCEVQRMTAEVAELERQVCRLRDEIRRCRKGAATSPRRALADDRADDGRSCADRTVIADDSFVSKLKRLYHDLELSNKNKSRRQ